MLKQTAAFSVARLPAMYPPVIELSWQLGVGGWRRVRFSRRTPCDLAREQRVLARWGWAGENRGLFEHPAGILSCGV